MAISIAIRSGSARARIGDNRKPPETSPIVANVAVVAAPPGDKSEKPITGSDLVVSAIHIASAPDCKWQAHPGAIAMETGLGATVTYQLIDRLIERGKIEL